MRQHISAAHRETAPVLQEATSLMSRKKEVETKQQLLDAFNKHFIISDEDLTILTSSAAPVDDRFFTVLARLKGIHKDCQVLLGSSNQTLGLQIMDQSSRNLNSAFEKLYRWIQREIKTLHLENPQISSTIRRALRILAERPSLFQSCLDFFSEARENTLSDAFYTALTGSSHNTDEQPSTKPIEFFAHDPLRYVGDMLAWTHSAAVSEREALEVLFISEGDEIAKGIQTGRDSEPWSRTEEIDDAVFDGQKALQQLVSRDLSGVARVLRQRIEELTQSHEDSILAYKIVNLLRFYSITFSKLLGADCLLLDTLTLLENSALNHFRTTTRDHIASIHHDAAPPSPELHPPEFLIEALTSLHALLKTHDTSLAPASSRTADFQPILAEALDPYLLKCEALSSTLSDPANTIFALNCLFATRKTLEPFDFATERVAEIDDTVDEHVSKLVEYQHSYLIHESGLYPLVTALAPLSDSVDDLGKIPALEVFRPQALVETSGRLDDFLPSALMDATENLKGLQSKRWAEEITEDAAEKFCEDFEFVVEKISAADDLTAKRGLESEDSDGEEDKREEEDKMQRPALRTIFPRTSAEIRVLLS